MLRGRSVTCSLLDKENKGRGASSARWSRRTRLPNRRNVQRGLEPICRDAGERGKSTASSCAGRAPCPAWSRTKRRKWDLRRFLQVIEVAGPASLTLHQLRFLSEPQQFERSAGTAQFRRIGRPHPRGKLRALCAIANRLRHRLMDQPRSTNLSQNRQPRVVLPSTLLSPASAPAARQSLPPLVGRRPRRIRVKRPISPSSATSLADRYCN